MKRRTYSLKRLKTIRSYSGLAKWLAETSDEPHAFLARVQIEDIPSPYAYSPTKPIYKWENRDVIWFETSHRCYEIFEVHKELLRFNTDDKATDWHIQSVRKLYHRDPRNVR